ncbi:hypothetical protein HKX48_004306 [Thoreauomyces humboldtii]|nr:hypothetical protein HKX48_004306 [Thoreauomyces humboldtii]
MSALLPGARSRPGHQKLSKPAFAKWFAIVLVVCFFVAYTEARPVTIVLEERSAAHRIYRRNIGETGRREWGAWTGFRNALEAGVNPNQAFINSMLRNVNNVPGVAPDLKGESWTTIKDRLAVPTTGGSLSIPSNNIVQGVTFDNIPGAIATQVANQMAPTLNAAIAAVQAHNAQKALIAGKTAPTNDDRQLLRDLKATRIAAVQQWRNYFDAAKIGHNHLNAALQRRMNDQESPAPPAVDDPGPNGTPAQKTAYAKWTAYQGHDRVIQNFRGASMSIGNALYSLPNRPADKNPAKSMQPDMRKGKRGTERLSNVGDNLKPEFLDAFREQNPIEFALPPGATTWTNFVPKAVQTCDRKRDGCSDAVDSLDEQTPDELSLEGAQANEDLVAGWRADGGDDSIIDLEVDFLSEIRDATGDQGILPGGDSVVNGETDDIIFLTDPQSPSELAPNAIYTGAVDRNSAWRAIGKSIKTTFTRQHSTDAQNRVGAAMVSWKRSIAQRWRQLKQTPRELRTEKAISDIAQKSEIFNEALRDFNDKTGGPAKVVLNAGDASERSFEVSPFAADTSEYFKSNAQISSEAQIEAFSLLSEVGVPDVLPDGGVDGIAISVDTSDGSVSDTVDPSSLFGASIRAPTHEGSIVNLGNAVAKFVTKFSSPQMGVFQLTPEQFVGLKMAVNALAKAADRWSGQQGALRQAVNTIKAAMQAVDTSKLQNIGSADPRDLAAMQDPDATPLPSTSQSPTAPLGDIVASDITQSLDAPEEIDATERLIGDSRTIVRTKNGKNLARTWKLIPRGLQKALAKITSGAVTNGQPVANSILNVAKEAKAVNNKLNTVNAKQDPETLLAGIKVVNSFNDLANDAILAGDGNTMDPSTRQPVPIVNLDLPAAASTAADAIRITTEISSLVEFAAVDGNALPAGGIDWNSPNPTSTTIQGPNGPVRELQATDIYKGSDNQKPKIVAWNKVIMSMKAAIASTNGDSGSAQGDQKVQAIKNAAQKSLNALKKNLTWRTETQKAVSPGDRKDDSSVDLDLHTENFKDVSDDFKSADTNAEENTVNIRGQSAVAGVKLNSEDLRSSDTQITSNIVEALSDLKPLDGNILPNVDVQSTDGATILPQSMYRGATGLDQVVAGASNGVKAQLAAKGPTMTPASQSATLKAYVKLQKAVQTMGKFAASSVGKIGASDMTPLTNTIGASQATLPALGAALKTSVPVSTTDAGVSPGNLPSAAQVKNVQTVAAVVPVTRPNPTSRKSMALKLTKTQLGRNAANGRSPASGAGNANAAGVGRGFGSSGGIH